MAFYGNFGRLNLGNECTLRAARLNIQTRLPDYSQFCICTGTADVSSRHSIPALAIRGAYRDRSASEEQEPAIAERLLHSIRRVPMEVIGCFEAAKAVAHTDMLLFTGTGMLEDGWGGSLVWPFDILKYAVAARLRGCKVGFLSIGVGPIQSVLGRWLARTALSVADYVSYRDDASKAYAASIGCDTSGHHVFPDLAFSLPQSMFTARARPTSARIVAVGVMDYFGRDEADKLPATHRAYLDNMSSLILWLVEHGYEVRLLQGDGSYDPPAMDRLVEILNARTGDRGAPITKPAIQTTFDLIRELSAADVVISPRFHNLVLALMLGKPVISLSYRHKHDELLRDFGLPQCVHPLDSFDLDRLLVQFADVATNLEPYSARITEHVAECRARLEQQYALLLRS